MGVSEVWGRVAALHRYPVKSLTGEAVGELRCDERGFVGDRLWSTRTENDKIGSGKTTRRFAAVDGLLQRALDSSTRALSSSSPMGSDARSTTSTLRAC